MLFVEDLTEYERIQLQELKADRSLGSRAEIILLSASRTPVKEIGDKVDVHPKTVRKWIKLFEKARGL